MISSRVWVVPTTVIVCAAASGLILLTLASARADPKRRVVVPKRLIEYDDGDSISIRWSKGRENVRILGIDTPEVMHLEHDLPYAQPFGHEAAGFLRGCVAGADEVVLRRSGNEDRYGRTLGYLFVDGKNYSVLVIRARLAYGPNPRFGDEGMADEHAACMAAMAEQGPLAFEEPWKYRQRMRALSAWMRKQGTYPQGERRGESR